MTGHRWRIAVADDEPDMREFFDKVLRRQGHEVVGIAADGRELLAICEATRPQLVISDVKMPALNGIEAAQRIWASHATAIILVSAHQEPLTQHPADLDHVLEYLVKPIKLTTLAAAIEKAMRRFQQQEMAKHESAELQQALHACRLIERAKTLLMLRGACDESMALRRLHRLARLRDDSLLDTAQAILQAERAERDSGPQGSVERRTIFPATWPLPRPRIIRND